MNICNNIVDKLVTEARDEFTIRYLRHQANHVLVGARAGCKIQGRIENNNLYQKLKEEITGTKLKWYLMEKYDWSENIFKGVAWIAHHQELWKIPRYQRVTLQKFIHGWLATNQRRSREDTSIPPHYVFCGLEESCNHMFVCSNIHMKLLQ